MLVCKEIPCLASSLDRQPAGSYSVPQDLKSVQCCLLLSIAVLKRRHMQLHFFLFSQPHYPSASTGYLKKKKQIQNCQMRLQAAVIMVRAGSRLCVWWYWHIRTAVSLWPQRTWRNCGTQLIWIWGLDVLLRHSRTPGWKQCLWLNASGVHVVVWLPVGAKLKCDDQVQDDLWTWHSPQGNSTVA